jgi:two-component system CitB family sensor kinase
VQGLLTVLGNLIDNAIDAAAASRDAEVTVRLTDGDGIALVVSDTGPGIPAGCADSIFMDGYSTKPQTHTLRRGLGLAIVHRLVQRLNGRIEVTEGAGAVFTVELPSGTMARSAR